MKATITDQHVIATVTNNVIWTEKEEERISMHIL